MRTYLTTCHETDCPNEVAVELEDDNLGTPAQVSAYIKANGGDVPACAYHGSDGVTAVEEEFLE